MRFSPSLISRLLIQPALAASLQRSLVRTFLFRQRRMARFDLVVLATDLPPTYDPVLLANAALWCAATSASCGRCTGWRRQNPAFGFLHLVLEEAARWEPGAGPQRSRATSRFRSFELPPPTAEVAAYPRELIDLRARALAKPRGGRSRSAIMPSPTFLPLAFLRAAEGTGDSSSRHSFRKPETIALESEMLPLRRRSSAATQSAGNRHRPRPALTGLPRLWLDFGRAGEAIRLPLGPASDIFFIGARNSMRPAGAGSEPSLRRRLRNGPDLSTDAGSGLSSPAVREGSRAADSPSYRKGVRFPGLVAPRGHFAWWVTPARKRRRHEKDVLRASSAPSSSPCAATFAAGTGRPLDLDGYLLKSLRSSDLETEEALGLAMGWQLPQALRARRQSRAIPPRRTTVCSPAIEPEMAGQYPPGG